MSVLSNTEQHGSNTATEVKLEAGAAQKRVLLADDNQAMLNIIKDIVEQEFAVVGAVTEGGAVLAEVAALTPDIVVLDIAMGEPDGIAVARQLQLVSQHTTVVFLTVHEIPEFIRTALATGAKAYVFKSRMTTDLIPALRAACSGRMFVSCWPTGC